MAPPDDPTQGLAVISGGSGKFIGTSISSSASTSKQTPSHETKRQVDVERVYQMDESGIINLNNFIDVERIKKVKAELRRLESIAPRHSTGPAIINIAEPPKKPTMSRSWKQTRPIVSGG